MSQGLYSPHDVSMRGSWVSSLGVSVTLDAFRVLKNAVAKLLAIEGVFLLPRRCRTPDFSDGEPLICRLPDAWIFLSGSQPPRALLVGWDNARDQGCTGTQGATSLLMSKYSCHSPCFLSNLTNSCQATGYFFEAHFSISSLRESPSDAL